MLQGDQEPHKGPRHKALEGNNSAGTSLSLQVSQKPVPVLWLTGDIPIGLAEAQARPEPPFTAQDDRSTSCECQSWVSVPPQAKIPQWPLSNHQVFPWLIAWHSPGLRLPEMQVVDAVQVHVLCVPGKRGLPHAKVQVGSIHSLNDGPAFALHHV